MQLTGLYTDFITQGYNTTDVLLCTICIYGTILLSIYLLNQFCYNFLTLKNPFLQTDQRLDTTDLRLKVREMQVRRFRRAVGVFEADPCALWPGHRATCGDGSPSSLQERKEGAVRGWMRTARPTPHPRRPGDAEPPPPGSGAASKDWVGAALLPGSAC